MEADLIRSGTVGSLHPRCHYLEYADDLDGIDHLLGTVVTYLARISGFHLLPHGLRDHINY